MKIYFGCGKHKKEGYVNVDIVQLPTVDVVHNMNVFPYPFEDNSADEILLIHILEHLPDTIKVMEEVWRICKNSALVKIDVPYYNSPGAFHDPTHIKFFTEHTFDYFTSDITNPLSQYNYYSVARFNILSIIAYQKPIFNFLPRKIQWLLAHHLGTVHNLSFVLQALK
ncbi:methyltransferase domain-containing protein [Thermodesulfobacteriota bacterium]